MASRAAWPPEELALLESHIDAPDWLGTIRSKMPARSIGSIKVRMAKLRAELGFGDGRRVDGECNRDGDEWMADAAAASQILKEATLRIGVWS